MAAAAPDGQGQEVIVAAVRALIAEAPLGHLAEVAASCRRLCAGSALPGDVLDKTIADACRAVMEEKLAVVLVTGAEEPGLVSKAGQVSGATYRHSGAHLAKGFTVSYEDQRCVAVTDVGDACKPSPAVAPYQEAIEKALEAYVQNSFPSGGRRSAGAVYITEDGSKMQVKALLASHQARPNAFWSGSWTSSWSVAFKLGKEEACELVGRLEFNSVYTEEGNTHLSRSAAVSEQLTSGTPEVFARDFVNAICGRENRFQEDVEESCLLFGSSALKAVRRALPLSKERFDWRPLRHDFVRDLQRADLRSLE